MPRGIWHDSVYLAACRSSETTVTRSISATVTQSSCSPQSAVEHGNFLFRRHLKAIRGSSFEGRGVQVTHPSSAARSRRREEEIEEEGRRRRRRRAKRSISGDEAATTFELACGPDLSMRLTVRQRLVHFRRCPRQSLSKTLCAGARRRK